MGDTEHFADPNLNHLIVQGEDNSGYGWDFGKSFGFDITDAWTQLCLIGSIMFLYGIFLIWYVTSREYKPAKPKLPKSKAWYAWDKAEVHYKLPVASRHNDFLGWSTNDNYKDFEGHIYLYCMPRAGPYKDIATFVKQRVLRRLKFENLPYRGFFFSGKQEHLYVDQLNDCEKKAPFDELTKTIKDIGLINTTNIAISLPKDPSTGIITIKFSPNFAIDKDFTREIETAFEKLKPDLIEFNQAQGAKPVDSDLEPIIKPTYVKTVG